MFHKIHLSLPVGYSYQHGFSLSVSDSYAQHGFSLPASSYLSKQALSYPPEITKNRQPYQRGMSLCLSFIQTSLSLPARNNTIDRAFFCLTRSIPTNRTHFRYASLWHARSDCGIVPYVIGMPARLPPFSFDTKIHSRRPARPR